MLKYIFNCFQVLVFKYAILQEPEAWMRFCENKKPKLDFKEFIIVLLLTGAKGR